MDISFGGCRVVWCEERGKKRRGGGVTFLFKKFFVVVVLSPIREAGFCFCFLRHKLYCIFSLWPRLVSTILQKDCFFLLLFSWLWFFVV